MVLGDPDREYGCFVGEVGVELDVAEPGLWGCSAESRRSSREALATTAALGPVTASPISKASASVRYLTPLDGRGSLCLVW